MNVYEENPL